MSKMILTQTEKNKLAIQYEGLVNKMTYQFASKIAMDWNDIKSMAYEGLALAIEQYDSERSSMNFMQFAAFAIRNNILTSLDNEARTIKMSAYNQKKAKEAGITNYKIRIDLQVNQPDDDSKAIKEMVLGTYEDAKFADGDVFETIYEMLGEKFSARDCEIFFRTFGLNGYEEEKCKDIAKMFELSIGMVSIVNKKIIKYIRSNENMCELLANL